MQHKAASNYYTAFVTTAYIQMFQSPPGILQTAVSMLNKYPGSTMSLIVPLNSPRVVVPIPIRFHHIKLLPVCAIT